MLTRWTRSSGWFVRNVVRLAGVAMSLGAIALATPAFAQGGGGFGGGPGMMGGMGRDLMGAPFSTRDLERFVQLLKLDAEQKDVVEVLLEAHVEQFQAKAQAIRDKMETARNEFREYQDASVWEGVGKAMTEFRTERVKMETQFMDDLKAVLNEQQAQAFPSFERANRREKTMRRGLMSGERMDVVRLVEEAKLTPEEISPLAAVLDQYSVDLDRELIKRNAYQEEAMGQAGDLFRNQDMEKAQKLLEDGRKLSVAVRDINRKYARQVQELLPEAKRAEFASAIQRASFPDIYRPSYTSRVFEAVMGFTDLTEDQRAQVAPARDSYSRSLSDLNAKLAEDTEKTEMEMSIEGMFRRGFGGEEGPAGELRRQRRDLDRSALENLRKILTPEQIERLPARDESGEGRGGPGQDGGRGGQGQRRNPPI